MVLQPTENKLLTFSGIHAGEFKQGPKTKIALDILLGTFRDRNFDPGGSYKENQTLSAKLTNLAKVLNVNYYALPVMFNWEHRVDTFAQVFNPFIGTQIYCKITVNNQGYPELGEAPCFSLICNLKYTEKDRTHLVALGDGDIEILPSLKP